MTKQSLIQGPGFVLVGFIMASSAIGVPPPPAGSPVGLDEWTKTDELPQRLFLRYDNGLDGVLISTPLLQLQDFANPQRFGGFPGFSVRENREAPNRRLLRIGIPDRRSPNSSTYIDGYSFDVRENDVIPLYDQIYSIGIDTNGVVLSLVTPRVREDLRPGLKTRTISGAALGSELFVEQHPTYKNRRDYDEVTIEFERDTDKVYVKLEPRVAYSGAIPPEGRVLTLPARPPLRIEVAKGGLLTARGRSYKVLNVVPPQDIESVGRLVGWIELAAEPVEPTPN